MFGEARASSLLGAAAQPFRRSREGLQVLRPEGRAGAPAVVLEVRGSHLA